MKKSVKFLTVFALCFSILANCLPVHANELECYYCGSTSWNLKDKEVVSGGEAEPHVVINLATGLPATCHVFNVGYRYTYVCKTCGKTRRVDSTKQVHSVEHK